MFKIEMVGRFNPFAWDDLTCPVCGHNEFTSVSYSGVYCDECNAMFYVRETAGDPGCVIDCYPHGKDSKNPIYTPCYECDDCVEDGLRSRFGSMDKDPKCPVNPDHQIRKRNSWKGIKFDGPQYYYLILKTGDYCSGWMYMGEDKKNLVHTHKPTQDQWNKFQRELWPEDYED